METKYGGCEQLAAASAGFVANSTDGWLTDRAYPDMRVVSSSFKPPAKTLPAILAVDSKSSGDVPCRSATDSTSDVVDELMWWHIMRRI